MMTPRWWLPEPPGMHVEGSVLRSVQKGGRWHGKLIF